MQGINMTHQMRRQIRAPMSEATRDIIALKMYASIETFLQLPSKDSVLEVNKHLAIIAACLAYGSPNMINRRKDPLADVIENALSVTVIVEANFDKTNKWKISEEQARVLKVAAHNFDLALKKIPGAVYVACNQYVEEATTI